MFPCRSVAVVDTGVSVSIGVSRRVVFLRERPQREGDDHVGTHRVRHTGRVRVQEQTLEHQLLQALLRLRQRLVGVHVRAAVSRREYQLEFHRSTNAPLSTWAVDFTAVTITILLIPTLVQFSRSAGRHELSGLRGS